MSGRKNNQDLGPDMHHSRDSRERSPMTFRSDPRLPVSERGRDFDRERTPPREQAPRRASAPYQGYMHTSPGSMPRTRKDHQSFEKGPDADEYRNHRDDDYRRRPLDHRDRSQQRDSGSSSSIQIPRNHAYLVKHIQGTLSTSARSSSTHWDEKKVIDLGLPKQVQATDWSEQKRIAGYPIEQVPLAAITYQGLNNWVLRV